MPRDVLKLCYSLVSVTLFTVVRRTNRMAIVALAHFSVKEYLISNHVSKAFKSLIDEKVAKSYLARLCLTHLMGVSQLTMRNRLVSSFSFEEIALEFPFTSYSVRHLMRDAGEVEAEDDRVCQMILSFLLERPKALALFEVIHGRQPYAGSPLAYASAGGFNRTIKNILDRGENINANDGSALRAASRAGRNTTVQLLLDRGAYVNARDGGVLSAAMERGRDSVAAKQE
jgi:hypothetical protein